MQKQVIPLVVKRSSCSIERMFKLQAKFQARFYNLKKMTKEKLISYQRLMLTCVVAEAMEALDWLNWKPWKKKQTPFNRYEFLNELVDIQHFVINAALSVGCTAEEFETLFANKHEENINRQKKGY